MKCPQCGFENPPGMKFCGECGAKLAIICPACQFSNPSGMKFCGECGARLEAAPPPAPPSPPATVPVPKGEESQRKFVTIVFADVSGFTAMSERLDHEEVNAIMRSCWHRLDTIVIQYGGTVDKHVGDAIMATFGANRAHEDDPIRAVKAGAAMQQALHEFGAELEQSTGLTVRMRIGINAGEVTVGEVAASTGERSVIGPAVNLASRLEHEARVGTVLVSEAIYDLTSWQFDYAALEPKVIKGIDERVATFELIGEKSVPDRDRGIAGVETELIGRETEMLVLGECLSRLRARYGTVLCLVGEAGVGKSRLTAEFRRRSLEADMSWYAGRCFSYEADTPFGLLLDVLYSFFGLTRGSSEAEFVESVRDRLLMLVSDDDERQERAALIASLFSVHIPNRFVDSVEPKIRHDLTMAAVKNTLLAHARSQPTILVLEDIHWVDSSSMSFFNDLAHGVDAVPIILLCQHRPDFKPTWGKLPSLVQLDLTTLGPDQSAALVSSILKTRALPANLAEFIHAKSDGNPFFIEEIVKSLIDSRSLVEVDGGWEVVGDVDTLRISATVQELLVARIDRLEREAKRTLEMASVLGRTFLKHVLEEARRPENHVDANLDILTRQNLVIEKTSFPEPEYSFRHALVQEVAYNSISHRLRSLYHERVAKATEKVFADRLMEVIETVANHYYLSQNAEQAVPYLIQAGDKARDAYASREALQFYEKAIEVIDRATKPRTGFLSSDGPHLPSEKADEWRIEALRNHADVSLLVGEADKALDSYQASLEICRRRAPVDARRLADLHRRIAKVYEVKGDYASALDWLDTGIDVLGSRRVVERRRVGAQLYIAGAMVSFRRGDYARASEWAREGLVVTERSDHLHEQAQCYSVLGAVARNQGNTDLAIDYRERALAIQENVGDMVGAAMTYNNLGVAYYDLGQWDKALAYLEKALAVREKMGDVWAIAGLSNNVGLIYLGRGQYAEAKQILERALTTARDAGFTYPEGMALINLGAVWLGLGDPAKAEECLKDCLILLDQMRSKGYLSEALSQLAEIKLTLRAYAEALSLGERAVAIATDLKSRADLGIAARIVGQIRAALGEETLAEQSFMASLAALEEAKNRYGQGKTIFELALLYGRTGRQEEKRRTLDEACAIFRHLGAKKDLAAAEREL